jgi:hypothetical protein
MERRETFDFAGDNIYRLADDRENKIRKTHGVMSSLENQCPVSKFYDTVKSNNIFREKDNSSKIDLK